VATFTISVEFNDTSGEADVTCYINSIIITRAAKDAVELYLSLFELSSLIASQRPAEFVQRRHERLEEARVLAPILRGAHEARAELEVTPFGWLNQMDPLPHVPGLRADPVLGCLSYAILLNEVLTEGPHRNQVTA
jgi:hypothetical protein